MSILAKTQPLLQNLLKTLQAVNGLLFFHSLTTNHVWKGTGYLNPHRITQYAPCVTKVTIFMLALIFGR